MINRRFWRSAATIGALVFALAAQTGCELYAAMAQVAEEQKLLDVPPAYAGLENQSVAVLVDADMATLYRNQALQRNIAFGVTRAIQGNVEGVSTLHPDAVLLWQYRTPQWNAMSYGEMARSLNVDRVVFIALHEYRLHPPGNSWLWEGVARASVGVIERDTLGDDMFVTEFEVLAEFPDLKGVSRDDANASQIETGLLSRFVEKTGWLFYQHLEPKYPDRYRPPPA